MVGHGPTGNDTQLALTPWRLGRGVAKAATLFPA